MRQTKTYKEFTAKVAWPSRVREVVRRGAIRIASIGSNMRYSSGGIRFPFYHHVFDDERSGFERQIALFKNVGEFITINQAIELLEGNSSINGNYFCLSFDDGLKSCFENVCPILDLYNVPAIFYIIPDYIGKSLAPENLISETIFNFKGSSTSLDFLTWKDCKEMVSLGMLFGSHTSSHLNLALTNENTVSKEMLISKTLIEKKLGACEHFCPPYGIPSLHYDPIRDVRVAKQIGFRSFVSGVRGPNVLGDSVFSLCRDHVLANWENYQLHYFFSRN